VGGAIGCPDQGRIGDGQIAGRPVAATVEVTVPGVQRNREEAARLPLERDLLTLVIPDLGRAVALQDVDHLLEELAAWVGRLAGWDLTDVGVIRATRAVEVDVGAEPAPARPGPHLDGPQILHAEAADDGDTLVPLERLVSVDLLHHPKEIGRRGLGYHGLASFVACCRSAS
jgi:hypothetical protein